jgi:TP901 family phage tail tape measure protein
MEQFAIQANRAAQALGASTLDYAKASLIYFQQGLGTDEANARAETTVKLANVLGASAKEVSDYMTAIWNNFDNGSKSLEYFADVITALGASTASSSEEIATGLEKFAAVANTVGLSYEYATAALATVVAQTRQSADTVGTAFKTIFARIQDLELGKTLDDGTTLGKYSEALQKVGININFIRFSFTNFISSYISFIFFSIQNYQRIPRIYIIIYN